MTRDEFEVALRRWDWVYGDQPERELPDNAKAPAVHPIARAMEFGHRSMDKRQSMAYQRNIRQGEKAWSRDPIQCTETRPAIGSAPVAPAKHDTAPQVQAAWLALSRLDIRLAGVVRLEYQVRDGQAEKARQMGIGRGRYREMLAEGKGWMLAQMVSAQAA